jgi:2-iminobutanoate/2-iminopropanoate deaminase
MTTIRRAIFIAVAAVGAFGAQPLIAKEAVAISAADAPKAIGPYVQAVKVGNALYLSGQIPLDPATGKLVAGDIRDQTRRVLMNLQAVLAAAGMTLDDAVMSNVYMTNLADFAAMNETYAGFFKSPPARATVEVKGLPLGAAVEISLIAQRGGRR